ncbi:MAG: class I SAM-dependent methyltransferase [Solirubrobacteraceae bacterium]|jgi:trans-aconitate 2-methyltransferase
MPPVRAWDGRSYDRISGPMEALGREVLARLELRGDEVVLDAGCGSGRITEALIERLPRGRVIAVDASSSMVRAAEKRLERWTATAPERPPRGLREPARERPEVQVRLLDLLELELEEPLDAILSTATFHWIADHERLFRRLRAALHGGGRLVAQCGGEGNIDVLRAKANAVLARDRYAEHFRDWRAPWNYAPAERTRERLLEAGFASADCWLAPAPRQPQYPREFLEEIVLGPHVQQLPGHLREPFIDECSRSWASPSSSTTCA